MSKLPKKRVLAEDGTFTGLHVSAKEELFCRALVLGIDVDSAFREAYPNSSDDEVKRKAPLLCRDPRIRSEIARLQSMRPDEMLLERTERLIRLGQLKPDKELEAIEFASGLRERIYKEKESVKTPADLDEFMESIISGKPVSFR